MDDFGNSIFEWYPKTVIHFTMTSDEEFNAIFDNQFPDFYDEQGLE